MIWTVRKMSSKCENMKFHTVRHLKSFLARIQPTSACLHAVHAATQRKTTDGASNYILRESYNDAKCTVVTRVCVCLSAAVRPHYCTDPDVTWGVVGAAP